MWHDDGSWHLAGRGARLTGKFLGSSGKTAQREGVIAHRDGRGFDFQIVTDGIAQDALDFQVGPGAKTVTFKLLINGAELPQQILIGKDGARPDKVQFTLPARPAGP